MSLTSTADYRAARARVFVRNAAQGGWNISKRAVRVVGAAVGMVVGGGLTAVFTTEVTWFAAGLGAAGGGLIVLAAGREITAHIFLGREDLPPEKKIALEANSLDLK